MFSKGKRFIVLVSLILALLSLNVTAYADMPIDPYYQNISMMNISMSINSGLAHIACTVTGQPMVTQINATGVLERLNLDNTYTLIKTWSGLSATGSNFFWSADYYVTTGYTYRFTLTETSYLNGVPETVSGNNSKYAN